METGTPLLGVIEKVTVASAVMASAISAKVPQVLPPHALEADVPEVPTPLPRVKPTVVTEGLVLVGANGDGP